MNDPASEPELSIVMPCLNEVETVGRCIEKAQRSLRELAIDGEVLVADNGSTDGSAELAERLGARVVRAAERGYGSALRTGIQAARGRYVLMGDADDSYDFSAIEPFVLKLREGNDLVVGNRLRGEIRPGAMPWSHHRLGNPVLTLLGRLFFRSPVGDIYCGLRAFRRRAYEALRLRTTGMEFACEMIIKSSLLGQRIAEVPIVLHKDGRSRPPHLRTWRDGWRTLRFMLLFSPLWLFLLPGLVLMFLGAAGGAWLLDGPRRVGSATLDVHTLLVCAFLCVCGYQLIVFAAFTKIYCIVEGFHPPSRRIAGIFRYVTLEVGVLTGLALLALGVGILAVVVHGWSRAGFGPLDYSSSMRQVIPAVTLMMLGVQTVFSSFFMSILGMGRRPNDS